jgi:hypothetical protein
MYDPTVPTCAPDTESVVRKPVTNEHCPFQRMVSSGMLRRVALVRTDVSEEPSTMSLPATRFVCSRIHHALVTFEVLTAVNRKNGVFWDVTPRGSYKSHTA